MEDDYPDEVEERLINEEYKIWKKNTPFLYGGCCLYQHRATAAADAAAACRHRPYCCCSCC
jgi:hypothetical protein